MGIVGRLTEIKNHELFLKAAAICKNEAGANQTRARFIIVGDGALRAQLEQQAAALGLADDVIFTGTRRDLENVYPALDIVALTSRNEGTPLTLIEAMACGRAVISTAVGGVVDLLGNPEHTGESFTICERGISVPTDDASAFAAGLQKLATDADLRRQLGERGRQYVVDNYSSERLVKDIRNLYSDLLKKNELRLGG